MQIIYVTMIMLQRKEEMDNMRDEVINYTITLNGDKNIYLALYI